MLETGGSTGGPGGGSGGASYKERQRAVRKCKQLAATAVADDNRDDIVEIP